VLKYAFKAVGLENTGASYLDIKRGVYVLFPGNIPWSHGLFMSVVWSILAAMIAYLIYRNRRIAIVFGLVVSSHWLLDFLVHPPELPLLFTNSPLVGLGLWITPSGFTLASILEVTMIVGGLILYLNHNINRYFLHG
jgi:hypothetical protein